MPDSISLDHLRSLLNQHTDLVFPQHVDPLMKVITEAVRNAEEVQAFAPVPAGYVVLETTGEAAMGGRVLDEKQLKKLLEGTCISGVAEVLALAKDEVTPVTMRDLWGGTCPMQIKRVR